MKLLGNRSKKSAPPGKSPSTRVPHPFDLLPVRLTMELERSARLAVMLARSRALGDVSVADFLAAMYLNHWEGLERYWADARAIESYLGSICGVSPQRWHKWLLEYDAKRFEGERQRRRKFAFPRKRAKKDTPVNGLGLSRDLQSVLRRAGRIAPGREREDGRTIPILTSESILLAMARDDASEVGRRLAATGLDVERLERAAKDPKRAPIH
ncbi:MAG TPA: hypothetical protein VMJ93_13295 [Verrucomicrobiae bacterium]|nr:hypothetical protein [Verrucomicrobiae bacterium]